MASIFTDPRVLQQMAPYGGVMNVGGGMDQAQLNLNSLDLAQQMEGQRYQQGSQLLDYVTNLQKDPFSIVPALQAYTHAGGGTLAPSVAFAGSGGSNMAGGGGMPSPYGAIADRLISGLAEFSGASPMNPYTGAAYTPAEMQQVRQTDARLASQTPEQRARTLADINRLHQGWAGNAPPDVTPQYQQALAPSGPSGPGLASNTMVKASQRMNSSAGKRAKKSR